MSTRETDDAYAGVIAVLSPGLRISQCRDQIQWLAQRRAGGRWKTFGYCATKTGLIRVLGSLQLRRDARSLVNALPDHFAAKEVACHERA